MRRRELLAGLAVIAWPRAGWSQSKPLPKIGIVGSIGPAGVDGLKEGLREAGLIENQSVIILGGPANAAGRETITSLVADYVAKQTDVIFASGSLATQIAKATANGLAIVSVCGDPVGAGFVESLARPGGNVTGLSLLAPDALGKRLEIASRFVPGLERSAILYNPDDSSVALSLQATEAAAAKLKLKPHLLAVRAEDEFERAFAAAVEAKAQAMMLLPNPVLDIAGRRIAEFELQHKLPVIGFNETFPKLGGLISYGPNVRELYKRAAHYVSRILTGTKPAELPVEQPTRFDLVVNLQTAKALGLKMPDTLLATADQVIE